MKPSYYKLNVKGVELECKDVRSALNLDFNLGNALKYIWRAGKKPGADMLNELKKCRQYIDDAIEELNSVESETPAVPIVSNPLTDLSIAAFSGRPEPFVSPRVLPKGGTFEYAKDAPLLDQMDARAKVAMLELGQSMAPLINNSGDVFIPQGDETRVRVTAWDDKRKGWEGLIVGKRDENMLVRFANEGYANASYYKESELVRL